MKFRAMRRRTIQTGYQKAAQPLVWRTPQSPAARPGTSEMLPKDDPANEVAASPVDSLGLLEQVRHNLAEYRATQEGSSPAPTQRSATPAQRSSQKPETGQKKTPSQATQPIPVAQRTQPSPSVEVAASKIEPSSIIEEETPYSKEQVKTVQRTEAELNPANEQPKPKAPISTTPDLQREAVSEPDLASPLESENSKTLPPPIFEPIDSPSPWSTTPETDEKNLPVAHRLAQPSPQPSERNQPAEPSIVQTEPEIHPPNQSIADQPPTRIAETIVARPPRGSAHASEPIQRTEIFKESGEIPVETSSDTDPQPMTKDEPTRPFLSEQPVESPALPQIDMLTNQPDTPTEIEERETYQPKSPARETLPSVSSVVEETETLPPLPSSIQEIIQPARETSPSSPMPRSTTTEAKRQTSDVTPLSEKATTPTPDLLDSSPELEGESPPPGVVTEIDYPTEIVTETEPARSEPVRSRSSLEAIQRTEETESITAMIDEPPPAAINHPQNRDDIQLPAPKPLTLLEQQDEVVAKDQPLPSTPDVSPASRQSSPSIPEPQGQPTNPVLQRSKHPQPPATSLDKPARARGTDHQSSLAPVVQEDTDAGPPSRLPEQPLVDQVEQPEIESIPYQTKPLSALEGWVVQRDSDTTTAEPSIAPPAPNSGGTEPSGEVEPEAEGETEDFDLEQVSRQVYQILRRRLRVEQERFRGRRG